MKKVVIVTGGIKGIGLGIAKGFFEQGHRVVLNYRGDTETASKVVNELHSKDVITIQADITKKAERETLISETLSHFGRMDVLVNNAGIIRLGRILDITENDFESVMQCNLYAPIFLSQLFANTLVAEKQPGSIINILSVGAYGPGNLAYCTSKAALLLASKCMAKELAKHNIRVNSISPSGVITELNKDKLEANPHLLEKMIQRTPLGRTADAIEMAGAVTFLASEQASYITGVDIPVDGGSLLT